MPKSVKYINYFLVTINIFKTIYVLRKQIGEIMDFWGYVFFASLIVGLSIYVYYNLKERKAKKIQEKSRQDKTDSLLKWCYDKESSVDEKTKTDKIDSLLKWYNDKELSVDDKIITEQRLCYYTAQMKKDISDIKQELLNMKSEHQ